jgi:hypothetical protein
LPDSNKPFPGFYRPRYTQVPDEVLDLFLADLSGAELKCLLYIIRRTFGFQKDADSISLSQFTKGIRTDEGKVLDRGTGLARSSVVAALQSLEAQGLITSTAHWSGRGDRAESTYALRLRPTLETGDPPPAENRTDVVQKPNHPSSDKTTTVVRKSDPQETVLQETAGQDRSIRPAPSSEEKQITAHERALIESYVGDFARELGDKSPLGVSIAQALNLFRRYDGTADEFVGLMNRAKRQIGQRAARESRYGYWFRALENLVLYGR